MSDYDFTEILAELDAGVFSAKTSRAMQAVALGAVEHGRKGVVTLQFTMERIGDSSQLNVTHKLSYQKPTLRGRATEEDATSTPLHVGRNGALTIMPANQGQLDFTSAGPRHNQQDTDRG